MSILSLGLVESLDMRGVCVVRLPCLLKGLQPRREDPGGWGMLLAAMSAVWERVGDFWVLQECERGFLGWFSRAS